MAPLLIKTCYLRSHSQVSEVVMLCSICVSQLFAHCVSNSKAETIITHSAPLSIAVHLHQTLIDKTSFRKSYHSIVWVVP